MWNGLGCYEVFELVVFDEIVGKVTCMFVIQGTNFSSLLWKEYLCFKLSL